MNQKANAPLVMGKFLKVINLPVKLVQMEKKLKMEKLVLIKLIILLVLLLLLFTSLLPFFYAYSTFFNLIFKDNHSFLIL